LARFPKRVFEPHVLKGDLAAGGIGLETGHEEQ
jgi:hypothetical protein